MSLLEKTQQWNVGKVQRWEDGDDVEMMDGQTDEQRKVFSVDIDEDGSVSEIFHSQVFTLKKQLVLGRPES